jgi:hypothetical protein
VVTLDLELISRAYACITDRQSAHDIRELVSAYQTAVTLHNEQWGRHVVYQESYETRLRTVVTQLTRAA